MRTILAPLVLLAWTSSGVRPTRADDFREKVAPILEREGVFTPESMDIVAMVDAMSSPRVLVGPTDPGVGRWIAEGSDTLYRLAIPRWAAAPLPEFATAEARAFFEGKKEAMIGPFDERLAETDALIAATVSHLDRLEPLVRSSGG